MKTVKFCKVISLLGMVISFVYAFFDYALAGPLTVIFGAIYLLGALITEFVVRNDWQKRGDMAGASISMIAIAICFPSVVEIFFGELSHLVMVIIVVVMVLFLIILFSLPSVESWAANLGKKIREFDEIRAKEKR